MYSHESVNVFFQIWKIVGRVCARMEQHVMIVEEISTAFVQGCTMEKRALIVCIKLILILIQRRDILKMF